MFRKWNRILAFLLSLALVITTFGSDLATAKVYADEGEIVTEQPSEQEDTAPEIFEEIPEKEEVEVVPPAEETPKDVIDEAGEEGSGEEDPENPEGEDPENPEGEDPENPEGEEEVKDPEEEPEAAEGEEKTVTVTYESGFGGSVSRDSESIDINKEGAAFEGATATPWNDKYTFDNWTKDGVPVSNNPILVPADITEDTTFKANFKAAENISEVMPSINESVTTGGMNVSVSAPVGLFPKGTTVSIEAIGDDEALATAQEAIPEAKAAKGVDITFHDADGNEIQPANNKYVSVTMSLVEALEGDNFAVVHDHGDVETIGANISTDDDGNATEATFASGEFSVFIVAASGAPSEDDDNDTKAVITYNFYVGDTLFNTQSVKEGDTLFNPGYPNLDVSLHQEFNGWYTDVDDPSTEVTFGEIGEITSQGEINVYANILSTYYVTFIGQNEEIVRVKRLQVSGTKEPETTVDDVEVQPNDSQEAFLGWATSKANAANKIVIKDNKVNASENDTLYASVIPAYWIHFDENDNETGGGATYTGPIYVESGVAPHDSMPEPPTRKGYRFDGWYMESECTNAFDDSQPLNSDITVFAKWVEDENTTYTVIIWKQKITDKKNATDKKYDYELSEVKTGKTNNKITLDDISSYTTKNYTGFKYNTYEVVNSTDDKISANGDTVVNVYYDRKLLTIEFYTYNSGWSKSATYTGLYGQTLAENDYTWPSRYEWYDQHDGYGRVGGTRLTFLDAFIFENLAGVSENNTLLKQYATSQDNEVPIRFYQQGIDTDEYSLAMTVNTLGGDFKLTDKYTGFEVNSYRTLNAGAYHYGHWEGWGWNSHWVPGYYDDGTWSEWKYDKKAGDTISSGYQELEIRFKRLEYSITFMDGSENKGKIEKIPYQKEISVLETQAPSLDDKDGKKFAGWYEDKNGQTKFDWNTTMPAANKVLYAYYTPIKYQVTLNTEGGTLINQQKRVFVVPFGTILSKESLTKNIEKNGYSLVGWYDDSTGKPYSYDAIRGPATGEDEDGTPLGYVSLTAKWRNPGLVYIKYDADGGNGAPEDNYGYAKDSSVVVGAAPTKEGYAFIGWQIKSGDKTSKLFFPNNCFNIEDYLDYITKVDSKDTITLVAFYEKTGGKDTSTEDVTITYKANRGVGADVIKTYKKNQKVTALSQSDTGFTRAGFEFLGWDKNKDATEPKIKAGETIIAADNNIDPNYDPNNTLYAIWKANKGSYTIEYYKTYPDKERELVGRKQYTNIEPGKTVSVPKGTEEGQIDWKKPAGYKSGVADPETLTIEADEYNADGTIANPQIIEVEYEPIVVTITVKGKDYERNFTGKDITVPDAEGDRGFEIVSIKDQDGNDITDIAESDIRVETVTTVTGKNVGNYPYTPVVANDNYTYTGNNYSYVTFEAQAGKLNILPPDKVVVKITGNTETYPYDGDEHSVTGYTVDISSDLYTEDDFTFDGDDTVEGTDVDEYPMNLSKDDFENTNDNFTDVEFIIDKDGQLTITKRKINVTVEGKKATEVFDGKLKSVEGFEKKEAKAEEIEGAANPEINFDEAIVFSGTAKAEGIAPKKYPMGLAKDQFTLSETAAKNFELGEVLVTDGELEITPTEKPIAILLTAEEIVSPYNGYTQKYVIRPNVGVVESQNPVQATIDNIMGAIADFFTIKADAADENLTFDIDGNTYVVKDLTVTAEGRDVGSYDFAYSKDYKVYLGEDDVTENFDINDDGLAKKLTITKATLTVTADNKSKVINAAEPTLTATITGLVGEDVAIKAEYEEMLKDYYTLKRDTGEAVGSYTIHNDKKEKAPEFDNYDVVLVNGTFTITGTTPTPTPPTPTPTPTDPTPTTPAAPPAAPAGAVLGATREVAAPQAAVLGARRGRTEDSANTASRVIAVIIAAAVAATVLLTKKKNEEEEEA